MYQRLSPPSNRRASPAFLLALPLLCAVPLLSCASDPTSSCGPASETCTSARFLGEVEGDTEDSVPITTTGKGSAYVSALITEISWSDRSVSVRGTLTSTGAADYDLLLYVDKEHDNTLGCTLPPVHANGGVVDSNWPDINDGSSQDRKVVFEIRHRSGPCDGGWQLKIEGNKTSVDAP
jgi:hypothetical protein